MSNTFKRFVHFWLEIGIGSLLVLATYVYSDVRWLAGLSKFAAYAWVILGVAMALLANSNLCAVRKYFAKKRTLDGLNEDTATLFEILSKVKRGTFARIFSLMSGVVIVGALAACEWYIAATLQLIFAEIVFNGVRDSAVELREKIEKETGASEKRPTEFTVGTTT